MKRTAFDLELTELSARLQELSPEPLAPPVLGALFVHYRELGRWRETLSLIGPGTEDQVLERHFGESLAALALIPSAPPEGAVGEILDVGSGAGFPGLVLAAARPLWRVTLVEARQKKWAFLVSVARQAALSVRCLDARVAIPLAAGLPEKIDLLTSRAIRLPAAELAALFARLGESGRALVWAGGRDPELPEGYGLADRLSLAGSAQRRIVEVVRTGARATGAGASQHSTPDHSAPEHSAPQHCTPQHSTPQRSKTGKKRGPR